MLEMSTTIKRQATGGNQQASKPGYKHTKLGWIPEEWEVLPLAKLSERIMVGIASAATHAYRETGVLLLRNQNILEGKIDESDVLYIDEKYEHLHRNKRLHTGDVITMRTGYPGVSAVVPEHLAGSQCFTSLITRPASSKLDSHFLAYYNNSPIGKKIISGLEIGGAQKNFNSGSLEKLPVITPGLPEQRRIAAVLGAWDRAIATVQQLVAAQQHRKQGLMHELLTGKRRFSGFESKGGTRYVKSKIGLVPSDWKELPLRKLFTERNEIGYNNLPLLSVTSTGVVLQSETERKDNSKEDKSAYKRICPGDIGYNTMRMWQGRSAVSHIEGIISPAYTVLTPTSLMDTEYGGHLFQLSPMIHLFYRHSQGMASDTWNLKYKHFGPITVPVPTVAEQRAIAQLLGAIDKYISELETNLTHLTAQKRGLMQQLLTGAVRVKQ